MSRSLRSNSRPVLAVRLVFKFGVLLHLILVCVQPVLAGWSLDGDGLGLRLHEANGTTIFTLSMLLIPFGALWWRPGRGAIWPLVITVALFAAETFQLNLGYAGIFVLHLPLGVGIVLASFALVIVTFRNRAATSSIGRGRSPSS